MPAGVYSSLVLAGCARWVLLLSAWLLVEREEADCGSGVDLVSNSWDLLEDVATIPSRSAYSLRSCIVWISFSFGFFVLCMKHGKGSGVEEDESTYLQGVQSCSRRDRCLFESWWGSPIFVLVKFSVCVERKVGKHTMMIGRDVEERE